MHHETFELLNFWNKVCPFLKIDLRINFFWVLGSFSTFRRFDSDESKKVSGKFPDAPLCNIVLKKTVTKGRTEKIDMNESSCNNLVNSPPYSNPNHSMPVRYPFLP